MNSVLIAVIVMVALSLLRFPIVFALILASVLGGLLAGMAPADIVSAFNSGLGNGAPVALAYATLGAFAVMLSRSGIPQKMTARVVEKIKSDDSAGHANATKITWGIYVCLIATGFISGTIVPVHIAFIPILVPPLLLVMNHLKLDRRAVACAITFSITVMYMSAPIGYGTIYLNDILLGSINSSGEELGFSATRDLAPKAMLIPASGMIFGLLVALLFSYRKERSYVDAPIVGQETSSEPGELQLWQKGCLLAGLIVALVIQLWTGSMVFGGIAGFAVLSLSGLSKFNELDSVFIQGVRLMATIGFIMIAAAGFAGVMKATGDIASLVEGVGTTIGDSKSMAALLMLVVGLFITMGIGSSFSTVPILAAIFVPLCLHYGFSPLATIAIIGTAGALGDAGSPASDSTLGPTAGLNADRQHDHIRDTVIPTFIHFNIPLILFGWIAAMIL
ncbi:Na+/H+ antiporter family protein [Ruegeria sp.]|uniref:Na+/H+ antiporter family protein n=1 Tax=Ruegeria sp. TaxID=1879320 RepID=UPI003C7CFBBC